MKIPNYLLLGFFMISNQVLFAQQPATTENNFRLQQCIEYALNNHSRIKSAKLDEQIAAAKIGEVRAAGLPQANIKGLLMDNITIQSMFVPTGGSFGPPKTPGGPEVSSIQLGVKYSTSATLEMSQLIFSGQYLVGLQAAKTYMELSTISTDTTKANLIQRVTKAYYLNLVNQERKKIFDANLTRLDSVIKHTKASVQSGFAEKIEVSRLEVTYNNLLVEKQKTDNLLELGNYALKFQMGMPLTDKLKLSDRLNTYQFSSNTGEINFQNIPSYKLLMTAKKLSELELKGNKAGYLPTLAAFGNVGYNNGALSFGNLYSTKWYDFSNIGLSLTVPVFDGFQKCYKVQQSKLALEKLNNNISMAEQALTLQAKSAEINLKNSTQSLDNQKNNMALAEEVAKISEIKYKQGIGSNLEIVNAESSLKEAQINYYNALYDVLVYKVDLDYALGNLK